MQERGYWGKDRILRGVNTAKVTKSWRSAHNEVTRFEEPDKYAIRLYTTDILTLYGIDSFPDRIKRTHAKLVGGGHIVVVNNGGWCTKTTREHINNALARFNVRGRVDNDKKRGPMYFRDFPSWGAEAAFEQRAEIHCFLTNGEYVPSYVYSDKRAGDKSEAYFL